MVFFLRRSAGIIFAEMQKGVFCCGHCKGFFAADGRRGFLHSTANYLFLKTQLRAAARSFY